MGGLRSSFGIILACAVAVVPAAIHAQESRTPSLRRNGGVYDASPSPKYFVDFQRAGHLAWTDLRRDAHEEINEYAIAFLDHYVLGASPAPPLTSALAGVSELRYDSELGRGRK